MVANCGRLLHIKGFLALMIFRDNLQIMWGLGLDSADCRG